jgi:hypothetical protein
MQQAIVIVIVVCAAWAVARRYAPAVVRQAVRRAAIRAAGRLGWMRIATRLEAKGAAPASCGDGCGTCGGCNAGSPAPSMSATNFTIDPKQVKRTVHY